MQEAILAIGIVLGVIAAVTAICQTYFTWPWLRYAYKYPECTRAFRVGGIKNAEKLSPAQIAGNEWFDIHLITGAARRETINQYNKIFERACENRKIVLIYISSIGRTIRIKMAYDELEEKMKLIKEAIEEANKAYFQDLETIREHAKNYEP